MAPYLSKTCERRPLPGGRVSDNNRPWWQPRDTADWFLYIAIAALVALLVGMGVAG